MPVPCDGISPGLPPWRPQTPPCRSAGDDRVPRRIFHASSPRAVSSLPSSVRPRPCLIPQPSASRRDPSPSMAVMPVQHRKTIPSRRHRAGGPASLTPPAGISSPSPRPVRCDSVSSIPRLSDFSPKATPALSPATARPSPAAARPPSAPRPSPFCRARLNAPRPQSHAAAAPNTDLLPYGWYSPSLVGPFPPSTSWRPFHALRPMLKQLLRPSTIVPPPQARSPRRPRGGRSTHLGRRRAVPRRQADRRTNVQAVPGRRTSSSTAPRVQACHGHLQDDRLLIEPKPTCRSDCGIIHRHSIYEKPQVSTPMSSSLTRPRWTFSAS